MYRLEEFVEFMLNLQNFELNFQIFPFKYGFY